MTAVGPDVTSLRLGDSVLGISAGCLKTYTTTDARLLCRIPSGMDFGLAASLPVVFTTVHLGLIELARLTQGQVVVVHAATGGVGLTAVHVAMKVGATVVATVGSEEKRNHLEGLGVKYITSSRNAKVGVFLFSLSGVCSS